MVGGKRNLALDRQGETSRSIEMTVAIVTTNPAGRLSYGSLANSSVRPAIDLATSGHYRLKDLELSFDLLRYSRYQTALWLFAALFIGLTVFAWQNRAATLAMGNDNV